MSVDKAIFLKICIRRYYYFICNTRSHNKTDRLKTGQRMTEFLLTYWHNTLVYNKLALLQ